MKKYLSLTLLPLLLLSACHPSTSEPASEMMRVVEDIKAHLNNPLYVSPSFTTHQTSSTNNYQMIVDEVIDFNNYYYYNLTQVSSSVSETWFYVEENVFIDARINLDESATYYRYEFDNNEEAKAYFNEYVASNESMMGPTDVKELTLTAIDDIILPMLKHLVLLEAGEEQLKPEFSLSYYLSSQKSGSMYFTYDLSDGESKDYYNILIEDNLVTLASSLIQSPERNVSSDIEIQLVAIQEKPNLDDFVLLN